MRSPARCSRSRPTTSTRRPGGSGSCGASDFRQAIHALPSRSARRTGAAGDGINNREDRYSEHGLGHLLNPADPESEDRSWIAQAWLSIVRRLLGLPTKSLRCQKRVAVGRTTVSSPAVMKPLRTLNKGKLELDSKATANRASTDRRRRTAWSVDVSLFLRPRASSHQSEGNIMTMKTSTRTRVAAAVLISATLLPLNASARVGANPMNIPGVVNYDEIPASEVTQGGRAVDGFVVSLGTTTPIVKVNQPAFLTVTVANTSSESKLVWGPYAPCTYGFSVVNLSTKTTSGVTPVECFGDIYSLPEEAVSPGTATRLQFDVRQRRAHW